MSGVIGAGCLSLIVRHHRSTPWIDEDDCMTNVEVEMVDRGLLKVLTLARRSTHLPESGVLNGASRTHPADGWASGCRRVRTTRSVGRWRERLDESEAEGLTDERSFGHRGSGWMPNKRRNVDNPE
jgi:hypothetical protein